MYNTARSTEGLLVALDGLIAKLLVMPLLGLVVLSPGQAEGNYGLTAPTRRKSSDDAAIVTQAGRAR